MSALRRRNLIAVIFASLLALTTPICSAQQVWAEGGIAAILVGENPKTHRPIYRKLYLAAVGPEGQELGIYHDRFRSCVKQVVVNEARSDAWWRELDTNIQTPYEIAVGLARLGQEVSAEALQRARGVNRERVKEHFIQIRGRLKSAFLSCGPSQFTDRIKLGIVNRVCTGDHADACGAFPDNDHESQFHRYSKVFEWFKTSGVRPVNQIVELGADGLLSEVAFRYEIEPVRPWPQQPSAEDVQLAFEASVVRLRRSGSHYSYIAAAVIGLHKETAERLIDVIDHPAFSIPGLPSFNDPTKAPLLSLEDELARARIIQCVVYQVRREVEDVSACAGYRLADREVLSCLTGRQCLPRMAAEAYVYAVEITGPRTLRELAATSMPRWVPNNISPDLYKTFVSQCIRDTANEKEATLCLAKSVMPDASRLIDCASQSLATQGGGAKSARKCLAEQLLSPEERKLVECAGQQSRSNRALVSCLIHSALTPQQQVALSCLEKSLSGGSTEDAMRCSAVLDDRANEVAQCASEYRGDYENMSLCALGARALPNEVTTAVICARQSGDDLQRFGGCLIEKELLDGKIGGEVGRGLNCIASSGGSQIGVLTCMAGPKVRPEQQIALECLSQSADALSYAGCVGGRLTLKELSQCRRANYGESGCYGPNNDIQKFLRSVGVDTRPGTVVGGIAEFHVNIATAQLAVAESALVEAVRFAGNVVNFVDGLGKTLADAPGKILKAGEDVVRKVGSLFGF